MLDHGAAASGAPAVAVVLTAGAHGRHLGEIGRVVQATLGPTALVGAAATGVLGRGREVLDQPAVALWVGRSPGVAVVVGAGGGLRTAGGTAIDDGRVGTLVVLTDRWVPLGPLVADLRRRHPDLDVLGGSVTGGPRPGDDLLLVDGAAAGPAVGLLLPAPDHPVALSAPGHRPIGTPLVVTAVDGEVVRELAGRPVLDRLDELLLELDDATAAAVAHGLELGQVRDERAVTFGPGDFEVRDVTGVDRAGRCLSVSPPVELGSTVQFLVRDAVGADLDLRRTLAGRHGAGALAFLGARRGADADRPDGDAAVLAEVVDGGAVAGAFCTAVIDPAAGGRPDPGPGLALALFPEPGAHGDPAR